MRHGARQPCGQRAPWRSVTRHRPGFAPPSGRILLCRCQLTPLWGPGLALQPTLSRFTALAGELANLKVLRAVWLEITAF